MLGKKDKKEELTAENMVEPEPENLDGVEAPPLGTSIPETVEAINDVTVLPDGVEVHVGDGTTSYTADSLETPAPHYMQDAVEEEVDTISSEIETLLAHGNNLTTYISERLQYSSYAMAVQDANVVVQVLSRALKQN